MTNSTAPQGSTTSIVKCAFYGRSATLLKGRDSIEHQLAACRECAKAKGWVILEEHLYTDEGKSGTSLHNRPGLDQLLAAAKSKTRPFAAVLFADISRLSRNGMDIIRVSDKLLTHGVCCYFVGSQLDSQAERYKLVLSTIEQYGAHRLKNKVEARHHKGRIRK